MIDVIKEEWLKNAKSLVGKSAKRALEIFSRLMFIELGQFILEFLQNAEDARFELGKRNGYFRIELFRDRVIIEHNGKPFDDKDIRNLCSISRSKKPSMGYKGYIGIGWKSVFKVSSKVEVYSNGYSFMFSKHYWTGYAGELRRKYNLELDEVPWQVIPIPIKPAEYILPEITRFIIYLDNPSYYDELARSVNEIKPYIFLFLEYINKIEIVDYINGKSRVIEWFIVREEEFNSSKVQEVIVTSHENEKSKIEKFIVFKKTFNVPEEIKNDPITIDAERSDVIKREVAIAFALDPRGEKVKPIEEGQFWGVYSFLPLHEVRSGLRFLIQADFIVHPGRRYINYEAKWNYWLMQCLAEVVKIAIRYLAKKFRKYYLEVFEYKNIEDQFFTELVRPTIVKIINEVLENPEVICIKGEIIKLNSTVKFDEAVAQLIKQGLIDEKDLVYIYGSEKHFLDPNVKLRWKDERRVEKIDLIKLLNKDFINVKMKDDFDKTLKLLAEVYQLAYNSDNYIPPNKKFIITTSKEIKIASEVYYSKIPKEISDLMKKFPEVREYIKKLDFIHEKLVEYLGEDLAEQIGVKKVNFKEVCEKVLLPKICIESTPPSKEEILMITTIVKRASILRNSKSRPIWIISLNGEIRKSNDVYYPLSHFKPIEAFRKLGIEFLNLQEYLKYDGDEESWKKFFEHTQVRGLKIYEYDYRGFKIHQDYYEIIRKIVEKLNSKSNKDINIKYIRILKQLYQVLSSYWDEPKRVRVFTDDNRLVYSTECLLHDKYNPEEKWVIWREKSFMIGPFISPEYLSQHDDPSTWRKFLVKALGVKEKVSREDIERFAVWYTTKQLQGKGYGTKELKGEGYDILIEKSGKSIYVEVKGRRELSDIELTEKETQKAIEYKQHYWLIVVKDIPYDPKIILVENPASLLTKMVISKKQLEEKGERL